MLKQKLNAAFNDVHHSNCFILKIIQLHRTQNDVKVTPKAVSSSQILFFTEVIDQPKVIGQFCCDIYFALLSLFIILNTFPYD